MTAMVLPAASRALASAALPGCVALQGPRGPWVTLAGGRTPQPLLPALVARQCRRRLRPAVCCSAPEQQQRRQLRQEAALETGAAASSLRQPAFNAVAAAAMAAAAALLSAPAALAADVFEAAGAYNPEGGSDTIKTVAGAAYIVLVVIYFVNLFRRRAKKATTERIASVADAAAYGGKSSGDEDSDSEDEEEQRAKAAAAQEDVTPTQAAIGAAQAGIIFWLLLQASTSVDAYFDRQTVPDINTAYTAHNIAVLVQTVGRGLVYLCTFIFGANALGLAALSVQLLFFPGMDTGGSGRRSKAAALPKVSVNDDVYALRRAFQEAERMGKQQAEKEIRRASRDESE